MLAGILLFSIIVLLHILVGIREYYCGIYTSKKNARLRHIQGIITTIRNTPPRKNR